MLDPSLNEKITQGIEVMCQQKGIQHLSKIELVIHQENQVDSKDLKESLIKQLPFFVSKKTKVFVNRDQLGSMKAIIKNIEGK